MSDDDPQANPREPREPRERNCLAGDCDCPGFEQVSAYGGAEGGHRCKCGHALTNHIFKEE